MYIRVIFGGVEIRAKAQHMGSSKWSFWLAMAEPHMDPLRAHSWDPPFTLEEHMGPITPHSSLLIYILYFLTFQLKIISDLQKGRKNSTKNSPHRIPQMLPSSQATLQWPNQKINIAPILLIYTIDPIHIPSALALPQRLPEPMPWSWQNVYFTWGHRARSWSVMGSPSLRRRDNGVQHVTQDWTPDQKKTSNGTTDEIWIGSIV